MTAASGVARAPARLSTGHRLAVGAASLCGLALAAYGVAGSYETVSELALRKDLPLPEFVPAGIDGGLIGVILLDLTLAWTGQPIAWLRQLVRLLAAGTVAANAAAGWPDLLSVGLHTAAPLMLLAMVEAARTVLRRRIEGETGKLREPTPLARWLLAPCRTFLLWRRMILWQTTSYQAALETERQIDYARTMLRAYYGAGWKHTAPPDLVWSLSNGVNTGRACQRLVADINARLSEAPNESKPPARRPRLPVQESPAQSHSAVSEDGRPSARGRPPRRIRIRPETLVEARRIDAEHLATHDRHASAATLRTALRIGAPEANHLVKMVRGRTSEEHNARDVGRRRMTLVPPPMATDQRS